MTWPYVAVDVKVLVEAIVEDKVNLATLCNAPIERRERPGGLLNFYHRRAA